MFEPRLTQHFAPFSVKCLGCYYPNMPLRTTLGLKAQKKSARGKA